MKEKHVTSHLLTDLLCPKVPDHLPLAKARKMRPGFLHHAPVSRDEVEIRTDLPETTSADKQGQ